MAAGRLRSEAFLIESAANRPPSHQRLPRPPSLFCFLCSPLRVEMSKSRNIKAKAPKENVPHHPAAGPSLLLVLGELSQKWVPSP